MTPVQLYRIEYQARQMRARVLSDFFRGIFRRGARTDVSGARTA